MKTKSTPNTRLAGASDERDAVLAHVRRLQLTWISGDAHWMLCERIIKWLLGRAKRYGKAKGGLGKKG